MGGGRLDRHDAALAVLPGVTKAGGELHRLTARVVGARAVAHLLGKDR